MLGYTRDPRLSKLQMSSLMETTINMEMPLRESSYLTIFLTIEPQLAAPDVFRETVWILKLKINSWCLIFLNNILLILLLKYDSIENYELVDKAISWVNKFQTKHPNREFKPTVMDTNGRSVFITRYFRPLNPPEELIEADKSSLLTAVRNFKFI
jgi:coiled-coil and C2 domain-containing protein 2A